MAALEIPRSTGAREARASRARGWSAPVALFLGAGLAATTGLVALDLLDVGGPTLLWRNLHWNVSALAALAAAVVGARASIGRLRSERLLAVAGIGLWLLATLTSGLAVATDASTPPSIPNLFALAAGMPAAILMIRTVRGRLTAAEEAAVYLDGGLLVGAVATVLIALIGHGALAVGGQVGLLALLLPILCLGLAGASALALVAVRRPLRPEGGFALAAGTAGIGLGYLGAAIPIATDVAMPDALLAAVFSLSTLAAGLGAATWNEDVDPSPRYDQVGRLVARGFGPAVAGILVVTLLVEPFHAGSLGSALRQTVFVGAGLFIVRQALLLRERSAMLSEVRVLHDENERLVAELRRELLERERVQAQLIRSSRMAAIGELAAGVAHEVNNPLTGVLGYAELLIDELPVGDPRRRDAEVIRSEAQRASSIVRALRDFARPDQPRPTPSDLAALVTRTVDLVRHPLTVAGVAIDESYGDLPSIGFDPQAVQQVVLNVLTNALQAMPDGGHLRVETSVRGGDAVLTIADDGAGMSEEAAGRAFEPFFSDRPGSVGLGLSVSHGLVESHGGTIDLRSRPGRGTTVEIRLPIDGPAIAEPSVAS